MNKKMKKLIALLGVTALLGFWTGTGFSATDSTDHLVYINVSEVALINAVGTDPDFSIGAPLGARGGEAFAVTSSNADAMWLQYTSIVSNDGLTRKITAAIDGADDIPAGLLKVTANTPTGTGRAGNLGAEFRSVVLTTTPADIVTDIGSGYTGTGDSGVQLIYALDLDDDNTAAALYAATYTVNVTYTLTASE